jgi:hypothetical protein
MSARVKICQIVPTTFHGMSIGSAITTSASPTSQPFRGTHNAIAMPSGTSIIRQTSEKASVRNSASLNLAPISVAGFRRSRNQASPFQKKLFAPIVS